MSWQHLAPTPRSAAAQRRDETSGGGGPGGPAGPGTRGGPPGRRRARRGVRFRLLRGGAIVVAAALVAGSGDAYYRVRSDLDATRSTLASTRHALQSMTADMERLASNLVVRTKQRDDLQTSLKKAQADLAALNQKLGGSQLQALTETIYVNTLSQCLTGVEQALNAIAVGDNNRAVRALQSVSGSCQQAQQNNGVETAASGGPAYAFDFADPYILRSGSIYYGYATNAAIGNVQVVRSTDLTEWTPLGDALSALPAWAARGATWAPAVLAVGSRFVLYYATSVGASGQDCVSAATSENPAGPFSDTSTAPLICQADQGGSIDPYPIAAANGTDYLLWKSNGGGGTPPEIWSAPLGGDGTSLAGTPSAILAPSQTWENGIVEGPAMTYSGGSYNLFYSANNWDSPVYAIGMAVCASPVGPCSKHPGPVLGPSSPSVQGPGGPSLFSDPSGALFLAFHGWLPGQVGYPHSRYLFIRKIQLSGQTVTFADV